MRPRGPDERDLSDTLLAQRGHQLLPDGVTAHKLRHTFASILSARGEDPPYAGSVWPSWAIT